MHYVRLRMVTAFIGIGSNIENRLHHLRAAVSKIATKFEIINKSSIYESPALLPEKAPPDWDLPFLNAVISICVKSSTPSDLLHFIQQIEQDIGRVRRGYWSPREIDIDIIAYNSQVVNSDMLTIPHAEMLHRDFVLVPFAEIAPMWKYPVSSSPYYGLTISEIIAALNFTENCKLYRYYKQL